MSESHPACLRSAACRYPWPLVTVTPGKCTRLRFIGMMGQAQNFQIEIAGHNMTLIAVRTSAKCETCRCYSSTDAIRF